MSIKFPNMHDLRQQAPLFLLPLYFVLHGFVQHYPAIDLIDALLLALWYEVVALVLLVICRTFLDSWRKAALVGFALLFIQFFFGAIHDGLKTAPLPFLSKYSVLFFLLLALLFSVLFFLRRTASRLNRMTRYLTILLLVLMAVDLVLWTGKASGKEDGAQELVLQPFKGGRKPNMYLVIMDEYAGRTVLQEQFGFDNSSFEQALAGRGFQVVQRAGSNYNFTPYSMASTLDMKYLEGISLRSNELANRVASYRVIHDNNLVRALKGWGYRFRNFSLFDFGGEASGRNHNDFYLTGTRIIKAQTLTGRLQRDLSFHLVSTFKWKWAMDRFTEGFRSDIKEAYEGTVKAAEEKGGPQFVYTHFIMPHYPYLYDEAGKALSFEQSQDAGNKKRYIGFLQYGNRQCLALIDEILKRDGTDPVIILMSDHGFTKLESGAAPQLQFKNIINVRMPSGDSTLLPDSITNVNLFRVLLNHQFGQRLPQLKDSSIFMKEY